MKECFSIKILIVNRLCALPHDLLTLLVKHLWEFIIKIDNYSTFIRNVSDNAGLAVHMASNGDLLNLGPGIVN